MTDLIPRELVRRFAVLLACAACLACGTTEPSPAPTGRFTLTIAGAADTVVTGGAAAWTDLANAGQPSVEHAIMAWADGPAPVAAVSLSMLRGTTAPALASGATFQRGGGAVLSPTVWLACPRGSVGSSVCTGQFGARDGAPVVLSLSRVEADTIAGVLDFEASGWLVGEPTASTPPDTVSVRLEFVMPRQGEPR